MLPRYLESLMSLDLVSSIMMWGMPKASANSSRSLRAPERPKRSARSSVATVNATVMVWTSAREASIHSEAEAAATSAPRSTANTKARGVQYHSLVSPRARRWKGQQYPRPNGFVPSSPGEEGPGAGEANERPQGEPHQRGQSSPVGLYQPVLLAEQSLQRCDDEVNFRDPRACEPIVPQSVGDCICAGLQDGAKGEVVPQQPRSEEAETH